MNSSPIFFFILIIISLLGVHPLPREQNSNDGGESGLCQRLGQTTIRSEFFMKLEFFTFACSFALVEQRQIFFCIFKSRRTSTSVVVQLYYSRYKL